MHDHPIELELVKLSGFTPTKDYKRRQDYLAALARTVDQHLNDLTAEKADKVFDDLDEATAKWFNAACRAVSNKKVIPDFDDEVSSAEVPMPEEVEPPLTDNELVEEPLPDEPTIAIRTEHPPKKKRGYERTVPPGRDLPHPEITPEGEQLEKVAERAEKKAEKAGIRTRPKDSTFGAKNTVNLDKWGFAIGSKSSAAASMFEKGCRMSDVKISLGGTYYNVVNRIIRRGHKVEHEANNEIRVTFMNKGGRKV